MPKTHPGDRATEGVLRYQYRWSEDFRAGDPVNVDLYVDFYISARIRVDIDNSRVPGT
jgi:hypothetical protein